MSEIITREQLAKGKLAAALTSLEFCFDVEFNSKYIEESGGKPSLAQLLKRFRCSESSDSDNKMAIRALEQISKDDLEDIFFVVSSRSLELHAIKNPGLPKKFALLKNHWRCPIGSDICVFFNKKTENLYLVHTGATDEEFSNAIDIALCGKQNLEKNNIDINNIPKASYSDEIFKELYGDDLNKSKEIDNITQDNFFDYDPVNYFIKKFGLVDKNYNNNKKDLEMLYDFFESKGISKTSFDNYMTEKFLINMLDLNLKPKKITRIGFSYGGNKAQVNYLFDAKARLNKDKKGKSEYECECVTVNGLELSPVQKNYFKGKLSEIKLNNLIDNVLKIKGLKDWVSPIETGVSANTIFFETDKNASNPHAPCSLITNKPPVKQGNLHKFLSLFFEGVKKFITNNQENNKAYSVVHACLGRYIYDKDLDGNKIKLKKIYLVTGWFVVLKSVFCACFKFIGIKIKDLFVFIFSRKKYIKDIEIIDTPEKEKPRDNNKNKSYNEIDEINKATELTKLSKETNKKEIKTPKCISEPENKNKDCIQFGSRL